MLPLLIMFLAVAAPAASAAQTMQVQELAAANITCIRSVNQINSLGQVVGQAAFNDVIETQTSSVYGFVWQAGKFTRLKQLDGGSAGYAGTSNQCVNAPDNNTARSINDHGQVAGTATATGSSNYYASTWTNASATPTAPGSAPVNGCSQNLYTLGEAINKSGDMAGAGSASCPHLPNVDAVILWKGSSAQNVFDSPDQSSINVEGLAINSSDQILIHEYTNNANVDYLLWSPSTPSQPKTVPLNVVPDGPAVLNDAGVVVGANPGGAPAYSTNGGAAVPLPVLGGGTLGEAFGIDNQGDIVGYTITNSFQFVGTLWQNAAPPATNTKVVPIDLNTLLPAGSKDVIQGAIAISNNGAILADGTDASGNNAYFVMTPGDQQQISGAITTPSGDGLGGVTVQLSGTSTATTTTAPDGSYSFPGLTPGTYTVTPQVPAANLPAGGDEFTPTECDNGTMGANACSDMVLSAGQGDAANFTGAYTVTGNVTGLGGNGAQGATVLFVDTVQGSGTVEHATATTNAQGQIVASASASSPGVQLAPGSVVASVDPLNGTSFFAVLGTGSDPDCVPDAGNGAWCDVKLDHDRDIAFSACVVPNPDGAPLPGPYNTTSNPIPGAVTKGDLEAVGCWAPQNQSGSGQATIYDSTQPARLDGIDVNPAQGTTLQLDTSGPTVTSNGPAQLLIHGWPVTPYLKIGLNYQGGSTVSVSDQGAGTGPLAPNLFGLPISLGSGGPAGYGLPFTESAGQTTISGGLQIPVSTSATWDPKGGVFEGVINGVRGHVPSVGLGGSITTTNRNGLTGQLCGSINDVSLMPWFGYAAGLGDGEISGAQVCYQFGKGLWTGSGMFKVPTYLAELAGDIYVTLTAQPAKPNDPALQFAGYKIQSFGLQFDHLDSSTFIVPGGEVRESGIPLGLGFFLQSLGGKFSNDFATGNVSEITGTMGISYGPEIGLEVGNAHSTELSLLRGDLAFTLAPQGKDLSYWNYIMKGALTFARLSPLELQLAAATVSFHWNPSPEADFSAQLGGSIFGVGDVLNVNGQSDVANGILLEGAQTLKAAGQSTTLDAVLNNYLLGVCWTVNGQPVTGLSYDLSKLDVAPTTGCNLGAFKHPKGASASAVTHVAHLRLKPGLLGAMIAARGAGAAPSVTLSGGGRTITATAGARPLVRNGAVVFSNTDTTYIGLVRPRAGVWTVRALPGSAGIAELLQADPLPSARVSATVARAGCTDTVGYRLTPVAGERELIYAQQGTGHVFVGRPADRSGTLKMSLLPAVHGRGKLLVYYFRGKTPVAVDTIGSFADGASNGSEAIHAIRLTRRRLTWQPACGATSYTVTIAQTGKTTQTLTAHKPQIALGKIKRGRATIMITALDPAGTVEATIRRTLTVQ